MRTSIGLRSPCPSLSHCLVELCSVRVSACPCRGLSYYFLNKGLSVISSQYSSELILSREVLGEASHGRQVCLLSHRDLWVQVIVFLKKKDKFISLVLRHIGTSALMDLLLRLVSCVEPAGLRQDVLHVSGSPLAFSWGMWRVPQWG